MFLDKAKIFIKAGNGGDGATAFHHEKFVEWGGPDGGDGGNGGSVYFEGDITKNTLIDFRYTQHYRAENGSNGQSAHKVGKRGKDLIIKVPVGTLIREAETGRIITDIVEDKQRVLALKGGNGGRGNARFATATRRAPKFSESGRKTEEVGVTLELMTVADVGLIGFPNVGKSTLLSVVSAARPKIANYQFTTLVPNLGTVKYYDDSFLVADIPGLIEGAADGAGLGHDFLRHINRVRLLVHLIDIAATDGRDYLTDYDIIRQELEDYDLKLSDKEEIVVATKIDLVPDEWEERVKKLEKVVGKKVYTISGATTQGVKELIDIIFNTLKDIPPAAPIEYEPFELDYVDRNEFFIEKEEEDVYIVHGAYVEELARKVVLNSPESNAFFQKQLKDRGVIKALKKAGMKDGDTVIILDVEFEYAE